MEEVILLESTGLSSYKILPTETEKSSRLYIIPLLPPARGILKPPLEKKGGRAKNKNKNKQKEK